MTGVKERIRRLGAIGLAALLISGCADLKPVLAPIPRLHPPPPARVKMEPPSPVLSPPPVLSPTINRVEADRLQREANARIEGAERIVEQVHQEQLPHEQQEALQTIQDFLVKARAALSARELERAVNLADKAQILANELARTLE
ncbi:MAG: hypothetical protein ACE5FK_02235 [Candidatus Methylomirabilia bacterium]